ncbi:MAG: hypothetical protein QF872_04670 [Gammaproteobacteria bacterium]|nr:hypothetical protein [Gammaproteobacteria bacterium]
MLRLPKILLLVMGVGLLLHGLAAGVLRAGGPALMGAGQFAHWHGPIMVCGFLGVVISLERATALKVWFGWAAPLLTGIGMGLFITADNGPTGALMVLAGSLFHSVNQGLVLARQVNAANGIMLLGALFWVAANLLLLAGYTPPELVLLWMNFLLLTIIGERIELSRVLVPKALTPILLLSTLLQLLGGSAMALLDYAMSFRIYGVGLLLAAVWAWQRDLAFRNYRLPGLSGYVAKALVCGWAWCLLAGILMLVFAGPSAGPVYDALLHAIFVGFIFSMIFGHAPIIFPAILGINIPYRPVLYLPLGALQLFMLLRIGGDMLAISWLKYWGSMATAIIIPLFLLSMLSLIISSATVKR